MTKTDLVNAVAQKTELSKKDSEKAVAAFISAVSDGLANGENVQIVGFGTFSVTERAARSGRNPATGAPIEIAASKNVRFRVGKALKERL